jgi:hypothetical protein
VELTEETAKQFPPQIVEAFKLIQQHINEKEAKEKTNQQPVQESQQVVNENKQEGPLATAQTQVVEEPQVTEQVPQTQLTETEQIFSNNPVQPTADEKVPDQEIDSPLKNGADLEPNQVNVQERPKDQAQTPLQQRLVAEKEAMDSVINWKDRLSNTLFSHEEGSAVKDYYANIKDKPDGTYLLAGTVCGLLSAGVDPESKKQIMEGLLSGKPLGNEYDSRISESVTAYHNAVEQMSRGNREPMTKLITDAALELGRQASQEDGLTPRHVMIGRMISNAMSLADEHKLNLPLNDDQWTQIRGAFELSKLAQKHHDAKQLLGKENVDMTSNEARNAVRDLLLGNAVENMIRIDKTYDQGITNTQVFLGGGYMSVDNLTKMMGATTIRGSITAEQVKNIMEKPDSYESAKMAHQLGTELLEIAQDGYDNYEKNKQLTMQNEIEAEKSQQIGSMQLPQPT